jgi:hypothetical protein
MQKWLRWMGVTVAILLACDLSAQERRAFERGGPENLVLIGSTTRDKEVEEVVIRDFSFTVDSRGKVINTGGEKETVKKMVPIYSVSLYVDELGAREAFQAFKGQERYALLRDEKIQNTLVEASHAKMLVLRFSEPKKAREVREDLSTGLQKHYTGSGSELGKFVSFFRKDFKQGDEVVIRLAEGQRIMTSVQGKETETLQNPLLAKALVKMWMDRSLVTDVGPLLPKP